MPDGEVNWLWDHYTFRFFAEGAIYRDVVELREQIKSIDQWCPCWSQAAHAAELKADRALAAGFRQTAASDFYRSSLYYFFAQFLLWGFVDAKRIAYENCARTFRRAAPLLDPPVQQIEIPFQGTQMPGYFRMPVTGTKPPCVVLIDGLDTTKEEQLVISTLCVQRGMATLAFDGPGQGEMFYKMKMTPNYVDAVQAVLDYAESLVMIDGERLGVINRFDIAIRNARLRGQGGWLTEIGIKEGRITKIAKRLEGKAAAEIDARGNLVTGSFVNPHLHLCKVWTLPMMEEEALKSYQGEGMGKAMAGVELASKIKEKYAESWIIENARRAVALAALHGNLHIRAFADVDSKLVWKVYVR